ncbi:hypothetical protein AB0G32_25705 [Streptomyces sp. NPDC023723]|uniref:hypothetical protein n=1 Tax=Streptomyces sp. NPDC023723 TaxID=3154323 RepID=UPI0033F2C2E6
MKAAEQRLVERYCRGDKEVRDRMARQLRVGPDGGTAEERHEAARVLVACTRRGDNAACGLLMARFEGVLRRQAAKYVGGRWHLIEDAVADAFSALATGRQEIDSVEAWLLTAVRYRALAAVRRAERERPTDPVLLSVRAGTAAQAEQAPGELLMALQTLNDTKRFLSERDQRLLDELWTEQDSGTPTRELAAEHGLSEDTYGTRRRRARTRAQEAMLVLHLLSAPELPDCAELRNILAADKQARRLLAGAVCLGTAEVLIRPLLRAKVAAHLSDCDAEDACAGRRKKWSKIPVVLLVPSAELRDRMRAVCDELAREPATRSVRAARPRRGRSPEGVRAVSPSRRSHRLAKTIGACAVAGLAVVALRAQPADLSGLPWPEALPRPDALSGPATTAEADGGREGGDDGPSGEQRTPGGTGDGKGPRDGHRSGEDDAPDGGEDSGPAGENPSGSGDPGDSGDSESPGDPEGPGDPDPGDSDPGDSENPGDPGDPGDPGGGSGGGVTEEPQDTTGPTVWLAGPATDAVGQQVLGSGDVIMETCGPAGTPTTYSVRVGAWDPSGVARVFLVVRHPSDGTFFSNDGVADGDAVRFDVPAYRTGPRPSRTVPLSVSVLAKDNRGNITDTGLATVTLHECGEPG